MKVRVSRYTNEKLAVFHGPRKLADYDTQGKPKEEIKKRKATGGRRSPSVSREMLRTLDKTTLPKQKKQGIHLLQNRTILFVANTWTRQDRRVSHHQPPSPPPCPALAAAASASDWEF